VKPVKENEIEISYRPRPTAEIATTAAIIHEISTQLLDYTCIAVAIIISIAWITALCWLLITALIFMLQ